MILATEAAAQKLAANDNQLTGSAQGDADDTPVIPAMDAPVLVTESAPEPEQYLPIDPEATSLGRYYAEAPAADTPAFSPEEYRRRQLAK